MKVEVTTKWYDENGKVVAERTENGDGEGGLLGKFKKPEKPVKDGETSEKKGIPWKKIGIGAAAVGGGVLAALFGISKYQDSKSGSNNGNYIPSEDPKLLTTTQAETVPFESNQSETTA